jgi:copper chaperone CopZ
MHCRSCEMLIQDTLSELPGIKTAVVSEAKGSAVVEFDESLINEHKIKAIIRNEGYEVK